MTDKKIVSVKGIKIGQGRPLAIIAGPCVIESRKGCLDLAGRLVRLAKKLDVHLIFKASYDKANRSSIRGFRGPGVKAGLEVLREVRETYNVPMLTDVHTSEEAELAGKVVDVLQIPAFLCRQTDLLLAVGNTGRVVNIKKGQFLAPWDIKPVIEKVESTGNRQIVLTERGASFGYNTLIADMRSLLVMRETGYPVMFDATHSVQKPGGGGDRSTGDGKWAPALARAAVATGCDAVFMETHINPEEALSDKDNAIPFANLEKLWTMLRTIHELVG